ncbi:MAG: hypothetical protein ACI4O5_04495 [Oscillospiraceae bacterium]
MYHMNCPKNRTDGEPIRVEVPPALDYADIVDYIRSWPNKLVTFVVTRLCDDDFGPFARELYEYICVPDHDGPPFEEWRVS